MVSVIGGISVYIEDDTARFQSSMRQNAALVEQQSQRMTRALGGTAKSVDELNRRASSFQPDAFRALAISALRAQNSVERLRTTMLATVALLGGGFAGTFAVKALVDMADRYTNIQNRIAAVTKEVQARAGIERELFDIAQRSRASFESTVQLYQRLTQSASELRATHAQILTVVETTQKALLTAGATTQEAAAAATQLSQALGAGRLNGDELRSILENAPTLAQAIAKEFGVAVGALKDMGAEGKLTSDRVFKALLGASGEVNANFGNLRPTVEQSLVMLDNAFTRFLGGLDQSLGATTALSNGLQGIARHLDTIAVAATALGAIFASRFVFNKARQPFDRAIAERRETLNQARTAAQSTEGRVIAAGANLAQTRARARTDLESFADRDIVRERERLRKALEAETKFLDAAEQKYRDVLARTANISGPAVDKVLKGKEFAELRQNLAEAQRELTRAETAAGKVAAAGPTRASVQAQERLNKLLEQQEDLERRIQNAKLLERRNLPEDASDPSNQRVKGTADRVRLEGQLANTLQSRAKLEADLAAIEQAAADKAIASAGAVAAAKQKVAAAEQTLGAAVRARVQEETGLVNRKAMGEVADANVARLAAQQRVDLTRDVIGVANDEVRANATANANREIGRAFLESTAAANAYRTAQQGVEQALVRTNTIQTLLTTSLTVVRAGLGSVVSFLGGPLGVAVTAAIAGWSLYEIAQARAAARADEFKRNTDAAAQAITRLREVQAGGGTPLPATDMLKERARVGSLREGLEEQGGNIAEQVRGLVGSPLLYRNASQAMNDLRENVRAAGRALAEAGGDAAKSEDALRRLIDALLKLSDAQPDMRGSISGIVQIALEAQNGALRLRELQQELKRVPTSLAAALKGEFDTSPREAAMARQAERDRQARQIDEQMAQGLAEGSVGQDAVQEVQMYFRTMQSEADRVLKEITKRIREEGPVGAEAVAAELRGFWDAVNQQVIQYVDSLGSIPNVQEEIVGQVEAMKAQILTVANDMDFGGALAEAMSRGFIQSGEDQLARLKEEMNAAAAALQEGLDKVDPGLLDAALREAGSSLEELKSKVEGATSSTDDAKRANELLAAAMNQLSATGLDFSGPIQALRGLIGAFASAIGMANGLKAAMGGGPTAAGGIPNPTIGTTFDQDAGAALNDPVIRELQGRAKVQQEVAKATRTKTQKRFEEERNTLLKSIREGGGIAPPSKELDDAVNKIIAGEEAQGKRGGGKKRGGKSKEQRDAESLAERLEKITETAKAGFFTELDRQTVEELSKIKGANSDLVRQTREAIEKGTALPPEAQQLRSAIAAREAAQAYQGIVKEYGTMQQIAPMVSAEQEKLNSLLASGKINADQYQQALADYVTSFGNMKWIDRLADSVGDLAMDIVDAARGMQEWDDVAKNFANTIIKIGIEEALVAPLRGLLRGGMVSGASGGGLGGIFSALFGGMFGTTGAAQAHTGGSIGGLPHSRQIPTAALPYLPRFHAGRLRSNELAAVLTRDETVLTGRQTQSLGAMMKGMAGMQGGGDMKVEVINQNGSQVEVQQKRQGGKTTARVMIKNAILDDLSSNGELAQAMQDVYGLNRMGRK